MSVEMGPRPSGGASPEDRSSHTFSAEASAWTMTCVGCHDDEIETGINNSHSGSSLTSKLTCHYASSCLGLKQASGDEHLGGRFS